MPDLNMMRRELADAEAQLRTALDARAASTYAWCGMGWRTYAGHYDAEASKWAQVARTLRARIKEAEGK